MRSDFIIFTTLAALVAAAPVEPAKANQLAGREEKIYETHIHRVADKEKRSEEKEPYIIELLRANDEKMKRGEEKEPYIIELLRANDDKVKRDNEKEPYILELLRAKDDVKRDE